MQLAPYYLEGVTVMFQILENQVTNNRLFSEDSESGAGPCWTWTYFVNSNQVLPSLYLSGLGSLYKESV